VRSVKRNIYGMDGNDGFGKIVSYKKRKKKVG